MRVLVAFVSLLALLVGSLMVPGGRAHAHGGAYRGPLDGIMPRRGGPQDPLPPPPRPLQGAAGEDEASSPVAGSQRRRRRGTLSRTDWVFWYHRNNVPLEQVKRRAYSPSVSSPLFPDVDDDPRAEAMHETRGMVKQRVLPALLSVIADRSLAPELRAAAYVGLGKLALGPTHIAVLKEALVRERREPRIILESAALGLGLLRRTRRAAQQPTKILDDVRETLFEALGHERIDARTRGFAAVALGLLGDQPSSKPKIVTLRLFQHLDAEFPVPDVRVGLLLAVGLQPATSLTKAQRAILRSCVSKQRLYGRSVMDSVACHAAEALGRVGGPEALAPLRRGALSGRASHRALTRACVLALGRLAARVEGADRVAMAKALIGRVKRRRDTRALHLALMSLADVLIAEIQAKRLDVLRQTGAEELLLQTAADGRYVQRQAAVLALGRIGRALGESPEMPAYERLRAASLSVLRAGLASKKCGPLLRAAHAVALGMLKDYESVNALVAYAGDPTEVSVLSAYAALGLGLIGQATSHVIKALRPLLAAAEEPLVRAQAAKALAMLRDHGRVEHLQQALVEAKSSATRGEIVWALADGGTEAVISPLLGIMNDTKQSTFVRAVACSGLGCVGDLELLPSLSLLTGGAHGPFSVSALMHEVLSIR